jgi:hypothetical protein
VILRPKSPNHSCRFWGPNRKTWATDFEAKSGETITTGFKGKPEKTITTNFEAKPEKVVPVVLRPNYWHTVDLGFEAQSRNSCSLSPRVRYRLHTASPDLSIIWPPSIWHMWLSSILCTRSPTPVMILVATCHAAPTTCTPRDKQTWFSKWNETKIKIKQTKHLRFEFKHRQVNNSSQSNQGTNHLISQIFFCLVWFLIEGARCRDGIYFDLW